MSDLSLFSIAIELENSSDEVERLIRVLGRQKDIEKSRAVADALGNVHMIKCCAAMIMDKIRNSGKEVIEALDNVNLKGERK